jgi:plastocyanin
MNKNLVLGVVVILILVAGGWFVLKDKMTSPSETGVMDNTTTSDKLIASSAPESMMESTDSSAVEGIAKEFTVTGSNFKFDVPEIRVKAGDAVKVNFKNAGGFHDFVIDEFNVKIKQANGPTEETVTFIADKKGTYEYYCSVGKHREMGMKGQLIVE